MRSGAWICDWFTVKFNKWGLVSHGWAKKVVFFNLEATPGKDAMNVIEITANDSEYYVHLVDKSVAGFERIYSNFERISTMSKMLTDSSACYKEIITERDNRLSNYQCYLI